MILGGALDRLNLSNYAGLFVLRRDKKLDQRHFSDDYERWIVQSDGI